MLRPSPSRHSPDWAAECLDKRCFRSPAPLAIPRSALPRDALWFARGPESFGRKSSAPPGERLSGLHSYAECKFFSSYGFDDQTGRLPVGGPVGRGLTWFFHDDASGFDIAGEFVVSHQLEDFIPGHAFHIAQIETLFGEQRDHDIFAGRLSRLQVLRPRDTMRAGFDPVSEIIFVGLVRKDAGGDVLLAEDHQIKPAGRVRGHLVRYVISQTVHCFAFAASQRDFY